MTTLLQIAAALQRQGVPNDRLAPLLELTAQVESRSGPSTHQAIGSTNILIDPVELGSTLLNAPLQSAIDCLCSKDGKAGAISPDEICLRLAKDSQSPYLILDLTTPGCLDEISAFNLEYLEAQGLFPWRDTRAQLFLVGADPFGELPLALVSGLAGEPVKYAFTQPNLLVRAMAQVHWLRQAAQAHAAVRFTDWLWPLAISYQASDVHIEPTLQGGVVRLRLDGQLQTVFHLPAVLATRVISRIKVLAGMDVINTRKPQDGRMTLNIATHQINARVAAMPVFHLAGAREKIVIRFFNPHITQASFSGLGLVGAAEQHWQKALTQPHGLIVVAGPTGAGKSVTLYNALQSFAGGARNICSLEDPVEMVIAGVNQTQLNAAQQIDFASGLRALLRQDPDILMVGEIRDHASATLAAQAALTGHLVLTTVHANHPYGALTRLLDLGVALDVLQQTLIGVLGQRLLRRVCAACQGEGQVMLPPSLSDSTVSSSVCSACRGSGYAGRVGVFDWLPTQPWPSANALPMAGLQARAEELQREGIVDAAEINAVLGAVQVMPR